MGSEDWVDKHRDVLHLNYDEAFDAEFPEGDGVLDYLLYQAAAQARDASLTVSFYYQLLCELQHMHTLWDKRLLVCFSIVAIHAPLQPALESGLFGLLGDARVILVDASDMKRKEQYRSFWEQHGLPSGVDPHPARFFDRFCQQNISAWISGETEEMRITWLIYLYNRTKEHIADADAAWTKKSPDRWDPEKQPWDWQRWVPNREHPWMRDTLMAMPELHPTVMIRLCTQQCPLPCPEK
jgi:hypothetical protein